MHKSNHVRNMFLDRANSLLRAIESASLVDHGPTIGAIREEAIISALKQVIPNAFDISQGFVVDAWGEITPQIDLIVIQRGTLSPLLLTSNSAIVPVELFRFGIEVKSRITRDTFSQVMEQAAALSKLQCSAFIKAQPPNINHTTITFKKEIPPFIVVAATSDLSQETLVDELSSTEGLLGLIVIDRCLIYRGQEPYVGTDNLDRVIRFFAYMFQHCIDLSTYVTVSEDMQEQIFRCTQQRHPERDLSSADARESLLKEIKTPSLLAYLYPPISDSAV